jgi:hypothetical protein
LQQDCLPDAVQVLITILPILNYKCICFEPPKNVKKSKKNSCTPCCGCIFLWLFGSMIIQSPGAAHIRSKQPINSTSLM